MKRSCQDGYFSANGLIFHYLDWGTNGLPPLVCLHGMTQTAHSWDEVAPVLGERFHVFALDARGHGDSQWPEDGDYSRQAQAADALAFLKTVVGAPAVVTGLSMGGLASLTLAALEPGLVRALMVIDIAPRVEATGISEISAFMQRTHEPKEFDAFVQQALLFNPRRSEANIRNRLSHSLKQVGGGRWTWKYDPRLRDFANVGEHLDEIWKELAMICCPTVVVRGEQSPILSTHAADELARAIGAQVVTVPEAGHSVMGDNPNGFLAVVEPFLRSLT